MREWLSIPIVQHALWLLAAGAIFPLVFGIAGRIFVFRIDKDDERNDPAKARRLMQLRDSGPDTPEPDPLANEPWPDFGGPPSIPRPDFPAR